MKKKKILIAIVLLLHTSALSADWASDTLASMNLDQKIGQLFVGGVYPSQCDADREGRDVETQDYEDHLVRDLHVGGLLLKSWWGLEQQQKRVLHLQGLAAEVPLLIAQDLECGLGSRIRGELSFPKNMTLGAVTDDDLLQAMGESIGYQALSAGVNLVLAPVIDVNTNPLNPVIHLRSFGENQQRVAQKGIAVMQGLQRAGVFACAKHFPGHGDSSVDSHHQIPHLALSRDRLNSIELYPFRSLIDAGVAVVLTAHLGVPALDPTGRPASLSRPSINGVLRQELGFNGLVITDDLLMDAIGKNYGVGEACKWALLAGNDLIMTSNGVPAGIECIKKAVLTGELTEAEIDGHVLRILKAKESFRTQVASKDGIGTVSPKNLFANAITLLQNRDCVPVEPDSLSSWTFVQVGGGPSEPFWQTLNPQCDVISRVDQVSRSPTSGVIAAFYPSNRSGVPRGIVEAPKSDEMLQGLWMASREWREFCLRNRVPLILLWFGSPYGLSGAADADALLVVFEDSTEAQQAAADAVVGAASIRGRLPVSVGHRYSEGAGLVKDNQRG